ncbi:MAG: hypothetical protein IKW08_06715 [Roseburia sp.]|nr:hypothetical protein [Roseburia sp.]
MQINNIDKWNLLNSNYATKHEYLKQFSDTLNFKNINKPVTVSISPEGLRALHGQKLKGSVNISKRQEEEKILSKLSYNPSDEHLWAIRGDVTNALAALKEHQKNYTLDDILSIRLEAYANQYTSLQKAYADGTREIWVCEGFDQNNEFLYHQVTQEEDFEYLDAGFTRIKNEFVSLLASKKNDIKIREIFYGERIELHIPGNYQEKMTDILDRTISEYKEKKMTGTHTNITQILQKCFNEDTSFAETMRKLYDI